MPSPTCVHLLQTKCLAELQDTFFIFVHLPCIHFVHCAQHTALDPTLFPHIPQGSILLKTISPFVPLTIILVFPTYTFNPLSSNALLHVWNLFLKSSKLSLISTQGQWNRLPNSRAGGGGAGLVRGPALNTAAFCLLGNDFNRPTSCYELRRHIILFVCVGTKRC